MNISRIDGLVSGIETEQIVRDLMRVERLKVERLYQDRQLLEWKKEDFRSVINKVRAFRDTYFDYLNPQSNLTATATLQRKLAASSNTGLVTVTADTAAAAGDLNFKIFQSAAAAKAASEGNISAIKSSAEVAPLKITEGKNTLQVTLNGKVKEVKIDLPPKGGSRDLMELCDELQEKIDLAFGEDTVSGEKRITVTVEDNRFSFQPTYASDLLTLSSRTAGAAGDILTAMNIGNGATNRLNLTDTMETVSGRLSNGPLVFGEGGELSFTINNVEICVEKTDTLGGVLAKINNSAAGVQVAYGTFDGILTFTAQEIGNMAIGVDEKGSNFFKAFGLNVDVEKGCIGEAGREAVFEINGIRGSRSSNDFTIEGITYNIGGTVDESNPQEVTISVSLDVEGIAGTIEKFVEDYNKLLDEINAKLDEEIFRDFAPLTAEQRDAMQEKEIEKWEEKARSGLLRREPSLENMLREMRTAIYTAVEGVHIFEIGLETSNDYRDQGKLVLKDGGRKLREVLAEDPDKVASFFTRRASVDYSPNLSAAQRQERFKDEGLSQRLSDILNDNIRTSRDNSGKKGILLEKAGIEGDLSELRNYFDRQIGDLNIHIDRVNATLQRKEEQYYRQFIAMEKALQQLYAQSDWLFTQLNQF